MLSKYSKFDLDNKLRVICVPMEGISSATVLALVGAGSRYEQKDKAGLSHFLEHMCFKGTQKRPTAFDISSAIDSIGGESNAYTGRDQTGYYLKVNSDHLELAFDILSDSLLHSLYLQEEIDREKGTIVEELNMYEDTPYYKIDDVFYELMYDNTPLGGAIVGEKKTIKSIMREDFVDYVNRFYQGSDMVLAVAGKVEEKQVRALAEKYFSGLKSGSKEQFIEVKDGQAAPRAKLAKKKTDQAHLYLGYPAFSYFDPDKDALEVLSTLLGGGMSSRLFIEIRERRGLAYYVSTTDDIFHETGFLAARAGLNIEKIDEAVKVIQEQFYKTTNGDLTDKEVKKAKDFLKGRSALRLENSFAVAEHYAEKELLENSIETPEQYSEAIEKVTLDDVRRVARRIFVPAKANLAVIGPFEDEERFLKLISNS